jgi:hypothetical protein
MDNSIQNAKIELIQWLTTLEDTSILQKIIALRNTESQDWWEHISEEERVSIERGRADAKAGKLNDNSKAKEIYGRWL